MDIKPAEALAAISVLVPLAISGLWMHAENCKQYPGIMKGFGGWLILLVVWVAVVGPACWICFMLMYYASRRETGRDIQPELWLDVFFSTELILNIGMAFAVFTAAYMVVKQSRFFVPFYKRLCVAIILVPIIDWGILTVCHFFLSGEYSFSSTVDVVMVVGKNYKFSWFSMMPLLVTVLSWLYIKYSIRVKNTFCR